MLAVLLEYKVNYCCRTPRWIRLFTTCVLRTSILLVLGASSVITSLYDLLTYLLT